MSGKKTVNSAILASDRQTRWLLILRWCIKISAGRCSGISICGFALADDHWHCCCRSGVSLIPAMLPAGRLHIIRCHVHLVGIVGMVYALIALPLATATRLLCGAADGHAACR